MVELGALIVENDVMVPMRDGVHLRTDIFRPAEGGPHPVLVQRYPYSTRAGHMAMLGQMVAKQGYAVVVQSCRGRFGSEGDFYPFHPDLEDSYDAVEWAAAQPWSNGKVGMYGVSYSGMTQWTAAMAGAPHLVCVAPITVPWQWADGGWYYTPGVLALGLAMLWSAQMTVHEAERRGVAPPVPGIAESERIMERPDGWTEMATAIELQKAAMRPLYDRRPLRDVEELHDLAPWFRDWCDHDDPHDTYFLQISAAHHRDRIDVPAMHVVGWYDYFAKGGLDAYTTLSRHGITDTVRTGQRLLVGPWNHYGFQVRPDADSTVPMHLDLSPGTAVMRFFAHHLKGEEPGYEDEPPVRIFVLGDNVWRDEREWPLARTEWTSYYLRAVDGERSLSPGRPGEEHPDSFVYDPTDPVPGSIAIGPTHNDPVDLAAIAARPDVLVYTTPPLVTDTEITGPVTLELWASTSVESTDFTAKLVEVFPDGSAIHLCQGIVRTGFGVAQPTTPGAVYRYEIDLWATSVVLKTGHRIRLDISSSEYPTFEPNPNTGKRITHDAETVPATQHVFHDERHAGVDQLGGEHCTELLLGLVREGRVAESRVDSSARRLLREKFTLGLFDDPFVDEGRAVSVVGCAEFREAGLRAQRAASTLLTNAADDRTPLVPLPRGARVYAPGATEAVLAEYATVVGDPAEADAAILRLKAPYDDARVGEYFHAGSLEFPDDVLRGVTDLCRAVPTVVDVYLDRPAVLTPIAEAARAVIANFGIAERALYDVLFGDDEPRGALPFDLPRSMAAVTDGRSDVPFDTKDPLFRFGHGLRYRR